MKYLLITILTISSLNLIGQVQQTETEIKGVIGELRIMGDPVTRIEWSLLNNDTTYFLFFKDMGYQHINSYQKIEFKNVNGAIDSLYQIWVRAFDLPKMGKLNFSIGEERFEAVRRKHMGFNGINIILLRNGASFGVNRKDIEILFGKSTATSGQK